LALPYFVAQQAGQFFEFVFAQILAQGRSSGHACGLLFKCLQAAEEEQGIRTDESGDTIGQFAGQSHEQIRIFSQKSGQGVDALFGQGRVLAAFQFAQVGMMDADTLGHAPDGISGMLGGECFSALGEITS